MWLGLARRHHQQSVYAFHQSSFMHPAPSTINRSRAPVRNNCPACAEVRMVAGVQAAVILFALEVNRLPAVGWGITDAIERFGLFTSLKIRTRNPHRRASNSARRLFLVRACFSAVHVLSELSSLVSCGMWHAVHVRTKAGTFQESSISLSAAPCCHSC